MAIGDIDGYIDNKMSHTSHEADMQNESAIYVIEPVPASGPNASEPVAKEL